MHLIYRSLNQNSVLIYRKYFKYWMRNMDIINCLEFIIEIYHIVLGINIPKSDKRMNISMQKELMPVMIIELLSL